MTSRVCCAPFCSPQEGTDLFGVEKIQQGAHARGGGPRGSSLAGVDCLDSEEPAGVAVTVRHREGGGALRCTMSTACRRAVPGAPV